jgi:8-oxo-dGTP pyrophosphatase MutT (NUDIX family)
MRASAVEIIRQALADNPKKSIDDASLKPAGVLLVVYPKDGEYCVLLNKRSDLVEHHKGEISFPGGAVDPEDENMLATAIRETHEEMGVHPDDIDYLGELDDVRTISDFLMYAFVATIPYPYDFKPSDMEVAEVLEVPISHLRTEASLRSEARLRDGKVRNSATYVYEGHVIFGATAMVLENFLEVLGDASI